MLTDKAVRGAAAKEKPYKLTDGGGLALHISAKGHKSWRYKYRFEQKEQLLTIGSYPDVSLAQARDSRDNARKILKAGRDPRHASKRARLTGSTKGMETFESLARRWHVMQRDRWSAVHAKDTIRSLERDIFPKLGAMPLDEIDKPTLLAVLRGIEARPAIETARRIKQRINLIYRLAKAEGAAVINPADEINEALKPVPPAKRYPAIVEVDAIRKFLADIDRAGTAPITRLCARLLALTAQRPGTVRVMEWSELTGIDWANPAADSGAATWIIPSAKMKQELQLRKDESFEHPVPLSPQAVAVLRAVRYFTGRDKYVFAGQRGGAKPISENAIGYLYNREGYKNRHVPHGWRSSFSTVMNELIEREAGQDARLLGDRLIIDLMLAHTPKGMSASELRYNRASYMPRRRELANQWANIIMKDALDLAEISVSPRRRIKG